MFVAVDIGNSNIVVGVHQDDHWKNVWRWETHLAEAKRYYVTHIADAFLEAGIHFEPTDQIGLSSVVPNMTTEAADSLNKLFRKNVQILEPRHIQKIKIRSDRAGEIGSDLVANAIAANAEYEAGAIIIDFGTALTFTVVLNGEILGVNIAPGLKTAIKSLFGNTARLPEVPLVLPESHIGGDTVSAIQNGVLWGYTGLVKEMIGLIRKELEIDLPTIATGGLSSILEPLQNEFDQVRPNLTLEGIRLEFS